MCKRKGGKQQIMAHVSGRQDYREWKSGGGGDEQSEKKAKVNNIVGLTT